jgi:hypothetical protein
LYGPLDPAPDAGWTGGQPRKGFFTEVRAPVDLGMPTATLPGFSEGGRRTEFRWLMESDVCKHCTHAACLDVCPTVMAGSACMRFGIFEAGQASARDPKYTDVPQRERLARRLR